MYLSNIKLWNFRKDPTNVTSVVTPSPSVAIRNRLTPNLVGSLSGHKEGSKAFARYRDIDEDMKKELVDLLD